MSCEVRFSAATLGDSKRLHGHLLERSESVDGLQLADSAVDEIEAACKAQLARTPHGFRRAGDSPTRRGLVIPFGATGDVAIYEISGAHYVGVPAARHQFEDDYH